MQFLLDSTPEMRHNGHNITTTAVGQLEFWGLMFAAYLDAEAYNRRRKCFQLRMYLISHDAASIGEDLFGY